MKFTAETIESTRLVKSEDLNHHGTLYAGKTALWFVEAGFIAAAKATKPENVVCLKIHGMHFQKPAKIGDILDIRSRVVHLGNTSISCFVQIRRERDWLVDGYLTFIHVDADGKPVPHGLTLELGNDLCDHYHYEKVLLIKNNK